MRLIWGAVGSTYSCSDCILTHEPDTCHLRHRWHSENQFKSLENKGFNGLKIETHFHLFSFCNCKSSRKTWMYSLLNGLTSLKLHPQSIFIHFYFLAFLETTLFYAFCCCCSCCCFVSFHSFCLVLYILQYSLSLSVCLSVYLSVCLTLSPTLSFPSSVSLSLSPLSPFHLPLSPPPPTLSLSLPLSPFPSSLPPPSPLSLYLSVCLSFCLSVCLSVLDSNSFFFFFFF